MNDLIERQKAIDAVKDADVCVFYSDNQSIDDVLDYTIRATKGSVIASIEQLSSTQPKIIRCWDCKHHHRDNSGAYYCGIKDYGYGWGLNDFCSDAERREE